AGDVILDRLGVLAGGHRHQAAGKLRSRREDLLELVFSGKAERAAAQGALRVFTALRGDGGKVRAAAQLLIDGLNLLFGLRIADGVVRRAVVLRVCGDDRQVDAALGAEFVLVIAVILLDFGGRRLGDAGVLGIAQGADGQLAANLFAHLIFAHARGFELRLELIFGEVGLLLAALNLLIDLVVVRHQVLFLRPLEQRLFLNQVVERR